MRKQNETSPDYLLNYDESLTRLARQLRRGDDQNLVETPHPSGIFADLEQIAQGLLADQTPESRDSNAKLSILGASEIGAVILDSSGIVQEANLQARAMPRLRPGRSLERAGLVFHPPNALSSELAVLQDSQSPRQFGLAHATLEEGGDDLTLIISPIPSDEATPSFLVLISREQDQSTAINLIATRFDLTAVEQDITASFVTGASLREIATARGRSYTTVRNQFQAVLEKTGSLSQTDLLRRISSLSTMFANARAITAPALAESRNSIILPRAKGRSFEVSLHGPADGAPILNFFSLFGPGITPQIEDMLYQRKLRMISPWRPGFAESSPPDEQESRASCFADDIVALLDLMGIAACPWLGRASCSRSYYALIEALPERMSRGVLVNGLVPRRYLSGKSAASKWTSALMQASFVSYPLARMILGTGERLMRHSDSGAFLRKMYGNSAHDIEALSNPSITEQIARDVAKGVTQGLDAGVDDLVSGFAAWSPDLSALQAPLILYHGVDDPNVPIAAVRDFAADYADKVTLIEEDGGGQLCYSHIDRILSMLANDGLAVEA